MNIFDKQRKIKSNLEDLKTISRMPARMIKRPVNTRLSIVKSMNRTVEIWRKRGVNNFKELELYLDSEPSRISKKQLETWRGNVGYYKLMYELYEEDQELSKELKRRCFTCETIKSHDEFRIFSNGKIDGYKCKECKKI